MVISRAYLILPKHFNATAIPTSFVSVAAEVLPVILPLNLNDSKSATAGFNHLYNIAINFLMFLSNYFYISLNYTLASQHPSFCIMF